MLAPIMGARFRPPAVLILKCLRAGTPLTLVPEPDNPYDPNAIKVLVNGSEVPEDMRPQVEEEAPGYGSSLEEILDGEWHIGYIKKEIAAQVQLGGPVATHLSFNLQGQPCAVLTGAVL